jgi:hypothetical protein
MYVQRNIEALSSHHCCSRKARSITHSECVFVALSIQHVMGMRHITICSQAGCTTFFHIISYMARLKKKYYNACFDILYNLV